MNLPYLRILYISNKCLPQAPRLPAPYSHLCFNVRSVSNSKKDSVPARTATEEMVENFRSRKPHYQKEGVWYSAFRLFAPQKGNSPDLIKFLQQPIDLRPAKIRSWWRRKMEEKEIYEQRYIEERHDILGNDLATAHFVVHRGGSVKFLGQSDWVKKDEDDEYKLPQHYRPDFVIEAIDCSNMDIHYEGLVNIVVNLKKLKWLSFNGCDYIDDWCIDQISGEHQDTLEYLDLGNCPLITERALSAMYRLRKLKTLKLNNIVKTKTFELTCLMLEEINPDLIVEGVTYMDTRGEKGG